MKKIFRRVLLILGAFTFGLIVLLAAGALLGIVLTDRVASNTVLELDLESEIVEYSAVSPFSRLVQGKQSTVLDMVIALDAARNDPRVTAVVAKVGNSGMGWARIQEIRDAIKHFRSSGKPAFAFAETFGEFGPGNGAYYLATAFDKIFLQPSGDLGLTGLIALSPFVRGSLDKLGIKPQFEHREEYKSAKYLWTEKKFLPPHAEETRELVGSFFGDLVEGIANGRGLAKDTIASLIDRGPFSGTQSYAYGLVDSLMYRDEVYARIRTQLGEKVTFLSSGAYRERADNPFGKGATIALIYGVGNIARGKSGEIPLSGERIMGSETIAAAFRAALKDKSVKAILFRIDSPGGSYIASDVVWREVKRVRDAGKPVIVSMGDVAASGGYFVAANADKIVAQPATITGSIGVVAGKMVTRDFFEKLGITFDEAHTSANATLWSSHQEYTPAQWAQFQGWLDRVYGDFVSKVAQGRSLTLEQARGLAKGRVWCGKAARQHGLIDTLGGIPLAVSLVKSAAGIPESQTVNLKVFPEPPTLLEAILDREKYPDADPHVLILSALKAGVRSGNWPALVNALFSPDVLTTPRVFTIR